MPLSEEEFRARLEVRRQEWRDHAKAEIERSRRAHEHRPYEADELFAVPKVDFGFTAAENSQANHVFEDGELLPEALIDSAPHHKDGEHLHKSSDDKTMTTPTADAPTVMEHKMETVSTVPSKLQVHRSTGSTNSTAFASMGRIKKRSRANTGDLMNRLRKALAVQREPPADASNEVESSLDLHLDVLPKWYLEAKPPTKSNPGERQTIDKLIDLRQLISKCERASTRAEEEMIMAQIYEEIDTLRFTDVTPWSLKKAKILDQEHGLPRIHTPQLTKGVDYPAYIRTDALGLHKRWHIEIFDGSNMFRGIKNMVKQKDSKAQGSSIDEQYKQDWRFHGEGHLVNGDWFANQLCAVRDGAHGSAQAGISGRPNTGATSISLSGDLYKGTDVCVARDIKSPTN